MARRAKNLWRIVRIPLLALALLVALPLVLTPLYLAVDPVSVPMLVRGVTGQKVVRQWRDIDDISDRLKAAVILSEDGQFCRQIGRAHV